MRQDFTRQDPGTFATPEPNGDHPMHAFLDRFSIRDLEEFSGVKAHTIRIWEKRYNLLHPVRTDTNIRAYSAEELKTILNVAFLNRHGHKISRICALSENDRHKLVEEITARTDDVGDTLNALKMAMLTFDEAWFERLSGQFESREGLVALLERIYVPLLEHVGILWQTGAIYSAQEHFLSNLIRQRIISATAALAPPAKPTGPTHVIFLPENEIHELGSLYINHRLRVAGKRTIYLGESVPKEDLGMVAEVVHGPLVFIGVATSFPNSMDVPRYLHALRHQLPQKEVRFMMTGAQVARADLKEPPAGITIFPTLQQLIAALL